MPNCPQCESERVIFRYRGRRVGSALGAVAGAAWGVACVMRGAQAGAREGAAMRSSASLLRSMAGAAFAGLAGGATIGQAVDANLLDNRACLACGYTLSASVPTVVERPGGFEKEPT